MIIFKLFSKLEGSKSCWSDDLETCNQLMLEVLNFSGKGDDILGG